MRYYLVFIFSLVSFISGSLYSKAQKTKSRPISVLILFMGDYKSEIQFDGSVQENIAGILNENSQIKPDKACEISARFQEVQYSGSRHLKINFNFDCQKNEITKSSQKMKLTPEYVRLKDLKTTSEGFYLSEAHKNVQFKIVELKY